MLCLQETWAASDVEQLSIDNYVAFHAEAQLSHGHPVGGLSSYFRIDLFADGRLVKLMVPVWWAVAVRWKRETSKSIVFVNTYVALHTQGVDYTDLDIFFDYINELSAEYGEDELIILGDMNAD